MKSWASRPVDEASLFNPAFCGLCQAYACDGYETASGEGLPFAAAFMVLPILLHARTRRQLPKNTRTTVAAWIERNADLLPDFAIRCRSLIPYTREALIVGVREGILRIQDFQVHAIRFRKSAKFNSDELTEDTQQCLSRAKFVGQWFSTARGIEPLMSMFGVCP